MLTIETVSITMRRDLDDVPSRTSSPATSILGDHQIITEDPRPSGRCGGWDSLIPPKLRVRLPVRRTDIDFGRPKRDETSMARLEGPDRTTEILGRAGGAGRHAPADVSELTTSSHVTQVQPRRRDRVEIISRPSGRRLSPDEIGRCRGDRMIVDTAELTHPPRELA